MPPRTRKQERPEGSNEYSYDDLVEEVQRLQNDGKESQKENAALRRHNTRLKNEKAKILQEKADIQTKEQQARRLLNRQYELRDERAQKWQKEKLRHQIMLEEQLKTHEAVLEEEDEKKKEMVDQMRKLKQSIAASSRLDDQIADETFREIMSCTFVAIKDCFWGTLRKKQFNVKVKLPEYRENLDRFLPDYMDNTREDKLHVCISAVAWILVDIVNSGMVFGWPHNDRIEAATKLWEHMPEPRDSKLEKKIKQWLALTKDILTDSDQESMEHAKQLVLEYALEESQKLLEGLTDMVVTKSMLAELSGAVAPFLQVFSLLQYQRCSYTFDMLPAATEDGGNSFDPAEMEGMFGEKTGWIKASLFPLLCRLEMGGQDDALGRTVICKARVAVTPETLDTDGDTDVDANVEETSGSVRAIVTEITASPKEIQRESLKKMNRSGLQTAVSTDEPMEDDLVASDTAVNVDESTEEEAMAVVKQEFTAEVKVETKVEESESGRVVQDSFDEAEVGMDESG